MSNLYDEISQLSLLTNTITTVNRHAKINVDSKKKVKVSTVSLNWFILLKLLNMTVCHVTPRCRAELM